MINGANQVSVWKHYDPLFRRMLERAEEAVAGGAYQPKVVRGAGGMRPFKPKRTAADKRAAALHYLTFANVPDTQKIATLQRSHGFSAAEAETMVAQSQAGNVGMIILPFPPASLSGARQGPLAG